MPIFDQPTPTQPRVITLGGLAFLQPDLEGVVWHARVDGWDGSPGTTLQTTQKLRAPGGWDSANPQLVPRSPVITGVLRAPDHATALAARDRLKRACSASSTTLQVADASGTLWTPVKRSGDVLVSVLGPGVLQFSAQLVASDPRLFGMPFQGSTGFPATIGGAQWPLQFPMQFATQVVSGIVSITNPAPADVGVTGPVVIRVDGPCSDFAVTHTGASGTQALVYGQPLGAGEWVLVDMEAETVRQQGDATRSSALTARGWSGFDPGVNSWSFSTTAPNTTARMTVTATPAYQ